MMIKFTASNVVAMILFIPLLIALGIVLAFVVPALAIIAAVAGMLFTIFYMYARVGLLKSQQRSNGSKEGKKPIDIKDYRMK